MTLEAVAAEAEGAAIAAGAGGVITVAARAGSADVLCLLATEVHLLLRQTQQQLHLSKQKHPSSLCCSLWLSTTYNRLSRAASAWLAADGAAVAVVAGDSLCLYRGPAALRQLRTAHFMAVTAARARVPSVRVATAATPAARITEELKRCRAVVAFAAHVVAAPAGKATRTAESQLITPMKCPRKAVSRRSCSPQAFLLLGDTQTAIAAAAVRRGAESLAGLLHLWCSS